MLELSIPYASLKKEEFLQYDNNEDHTIKKNDLTKQLKQRCNHPLLFFSKNSKRYMPTPHQSYPFKCAYRKSGSEIFSRLILQPHLLRSIVMLRCHHID